MNDSEIYLRKVYNYPGHLAVITDALKKKGVRFDVSSFKDGEVTYTKDNIMVLRGDAGKVVDCLFERKPQRITRKQSALLFLRRHIRLISTACYQGLNRICRTISYAHKRTLTPKAQAEARPKGGGTNHDGSPPLPPAPR